MRRHLPGSALVTVLGLVTILAAVVGTLAIGTQVESLRVDAASAARQRELAALSAVELAAALIHDTTNRDQPLYGTVRQATVGNVTAQFTITDQAGLLPLEMLYGDVTSPRREELATSVLAAIEGGLALADLPEPRHLVSFPLIRQRNQNLYVLADDLDLGPAITTLGYEPRRAVFDVGDDQTASAGLALGMFLRQGGPLAVNVNTARPEVLTLLFRSRGIGYEAGTIVTARNQRPFTSVADLRERHILSDEAFQSVASLLTTQTGPYMVTVQADLDGTRETFVAFLKTDPEDQSLHVERFFFVHEPRL